MNQENEQRFQVLGIYAYLHHSLDYALCGRADKIVEKRRNAAAQLKAGRRPA
jgi:hypothetical protein